MSKNITAFFTSDKASVPSDESASLQQVQEQKKSSRTLKSSTITKWINKYLAKVNALVWLKYEDNGKGEVVQMKCLICTQFQRQIRHNRDFSDAWVNGTRSLRLSNASDHSTTKCHQHAYRLYVNNLNSKGDCVDNLYDQLQSDASQPTLVDNVAKLSKVQEEQAIKKFEIAYFVAKKELPFTLYEDLLKLEKHHGVDVGDAYTTRKQCGEFIDVHGEYIASQLKENLAKAKFYSVLTDGSTDSSITEKEVVYVLYFDPNSKSDEVEVKLSFLYLKDIKKADAPGIKAAIEDSFNSLGILPSELYSKLVGFGADGASVNSGNKNGVKALLEEKAPWLIYTWCVAHKLELALKDALKDTVFKKVDQMLLKLYALYHRSPKKLHELKHLHDLLKDSFEFEEGSLKPKRAGGTRWIAFKLSALRLVLDKYGIYLQHLEHLTNEINNTDSEKIKGYLHQWKSSHMLLYIALFIDILNPAAILSKAFQEDGLDSVAAVHNIKRAKQSLDTLMSRLFEDLPSVKHLMRNTKKTPSMYIYQGIQFPTSSFEKAIEDVKTAKDSFIKSVHSTMNARLEGASSIQLDAVASILNTEHWKAVSEVEGVEFADQKIAELVEHFHTVMLKQGFSTSASSHEVLEEWHDLLSYAINFLQPDKSNYKKTWKLLFNCSYSSNWKNVLILIEVLFSVPVSNAKLERMFSQLKRTKTDSRCSLAENRLTNVLRIVEEGPPLGSFNVLPVVQLWQSQKVRRPNQKRRKKYKARQKKVKYYNKPEDEADAQATTSNEIEVVSDPDSNLETDSDDQADQEVNTEEKHLSDNSDSDISDISSFTGFLPEDLF